MIDDICENETFQKKLIFTNIRKNTEVYKQVQAEVWQQHKAEELEISFEFPFFTQTNENKV